MATAATRTRVIGVPLQPGETPPPGSLVIGTMAWSALPSPAPARDRRLLRRAGWALWLSLVIPSGLFVLAIAGAVLVSFWR